MKKKISIIISIMLILTLIGCIVWVISAKKGSGKSETKTFELSDFKNISASHAFEVIIEKSDEFHVEVTYDDNLAEYIKVKVEGDTLKLSMDNKHHYRNVDVKATIKMPDIYAIKGSGVSKFGIKEGFQFEHDFDIDLTGINKLNGNIKTGDVFVNLRGCSKVTLKGSGNDLSCSIFGFCGITTEDFEVESKKFKLKIKH